MDSYAFEKWHKIIVRITEVIKFIDYLCLIIYIHFIFRTTVRIDSELRTAIYPNRIIYGPFLDRKSVV